MIRAARLGGTVLTLAFAAAGCGGAAAGAPSQEDVAQYAGPIQSDNVELGKERYAALCGSCHAEGAGETSSEEDVAPNILGIQWTPAQMRAQIREGEGTMPAIKPKRLSDEDMEAVLAYLVTLDAVQEK